MGALVDEHRGVGPAQQPVGVVGLQRIPGLPDADREPQTMLADEERFAERGDDPARHAFDVRVTSVGEQNGELVAAEPGDDVGRPGAVRETLGDGDQERVAGLVAELVVDRFELVQIDVEEGSVLPGVLRAVHGVAQLGGELQTVGQAGELVMERLVGDHVDEAAVLERGGGVRGDA